MMILLAQTRIDPTLWIWLGVLVVIVLIGGAVLIAIRRKLFAENPNEDFQSGGMLEQMRIMHQQGKISDEEYEETRSALINKVSANKPLPEPETDRKE